MRAGSPATRPHGRGSAFARRLIIAGVLLYIAFLIATIPASVAAWLAPRLTDNLIELEAPRGTLWRGSASTLRIAAQASGGLRFSSVAWDAILWRLLKGELAFDLAVADQAGPVKATLAYGFGGARLSNVEALLPASVLLAFAPHLALWQPGGQFRIATESFAFDRNSASGQAELNWLNASSSLSKINPLGDYRAAISASGGKAEYRVATVRGALQLDGAGAWTAGQGLSFSGNARADPQFQAQLSDLLRLLGREQSPGVYRLSFAAKM